MLKKLLSVFLCMCIIMYQGAAFAAKPDKPTQEPQDTVLSTSTDRLEPSISDFLLEQERMQKEELEAKTKTDKFIIKYKDTPPGRSDAKKQPKQKDARIVSEDRVKNSKNKDVSKLKLKDKVDIKQFVQDTLANDTNREIEYIQPDFAMQFSSYNEDIFLDIGMNGDSFSGAKYAVSQAEAQKATYETVSQSVYGVVYSQNIMVALIDTGVDISHAALSKYIYTSQSEQNNGKDDDANGYIDDVHGWNFANKSNVLYDQKNPLDSAHATHIAGIIATTASEAQTNVTILPLKVFSNGVAYTSDIIEAIQYAQSMGAKVVNASWGSTDDNIALREAIAGSSMLFVCAAGNARQDLSSAPIYPAAFDLPNVISVTSINADGGLSYYSNYSAKVVDIAAIGRDVYSTLPNGEYGKQTGTSMSAGVVSGGAAALFARAAGASTLGSGEDGAVSPGTSATGSSDAGVPAASAPAASAPTVGAGQIKWQLIASADRINTLDGYVENAARINVPAAMAGQSGGAMQQISAKDDFNTAGYNKATSAWQEYGDSPIVQVAAGGGHTLILKKDGTVWSEGYNGYGQCGVGTISFNERLGQVIGLTGITAISAGYRHSMALKNDGTVWTWGYGNNGQLGTNVYGYVSTPAQAVGLLGAIAIGAGSSFSAALKNGGTVWSWGDNSYGQLGDGSTTYKSTPVQSIGLNEIASISVGSIHGMALKSDKTVWTWGDSRNGQLGFGYGDRYRATPTQVPNLNNIVSVSAGDSHSLAAKTDGTVWSWGSNSNGQRGTFGASELPTIVDVVNNIVSVSAGTTHSIALKNDGTVWGWGNNDCGQIGGDIRSIRYTPAQIVSLSGIATTAVGKDCSYALKSDGSLFSLGANYFSQIGDGTYVDQTIPTSSIVFAKATAVSVGEYNSLILKNDGTVWESYTDYYSYFVNGAGLSKTTPSQVNGLSGITAVSVGDNYNLALKNDGKVWAWGRNNSGQLGDGTKIDRATPAQVKELSGVIALVAGSAQGVALKGDGTVWEWGDNTYGQLGDGTTANRLTPVQVSNLSGVTAISSYNTHVVALKNDGTVFAWGNNGKGQLGDGTTINRLTPVQVSTLSNITSVSAGKTHSSAVKNDGTVWAWGDNTYGQAGNAMRGNVVTPIRVNGIVDVRAVSSGFGCNLAIKKDGTAWAWGDNDYGQLGDGTIQYKTTPIQVSRLSQVTSISAGGYNSTAIKSDGTVWSWGRNDYGQLGLPSVAMYTTPIRSQTVVDDYPNTFDAAQVQNLFAATPLTFSGGINSKLDQDFFAIKPADEKNYTIELTSADQNVTLEVFDSSLTSISSAKQASLPLKQNAVYYVRASYSQSVAYAPAQYSIKISQKAPAIILSDGVVNSGSPTSNNTFSVTAKNVRYNDGTYPTVVLIPVWTAVNNQDDIIWYSATKTLGTNDWVVTVNIADHRGRLGEYIAHAYAQDAQLNRQFIGETRVVVDVQIAAVSLVHTAGETYEVAFTVSNVIAIARRTFTINYNAAALDVVDLAAQTGRMQTSVGAVEGTDITITSFAPGTITFVMNSNDSANLSWSGALNVVKFRAKTNGTTPISFKI